MFRMIFVILSLACFIVGLCLSLAFRSGRIKRPKIVFAILNTLYPVGYFLLGLHFGVNWDIITKIFLGV